MTWPSLKTDETCSYFYTSSKKMAYFLANGLAKLSVNGHLQVLAKHHTTNIERPDPVCVLVVLTLCPSFPIQSDPWAQK